MPQSRPRAKERACDKAIKETLSYRAVFKYPMSFYQLATFLISKRKFGYKFFSKSLRRLVKKKTIGTKGGKYYLPLIKPHSWNIRDKQTKSLFVELAHVCNLFEAIPWIKLAAVTGALAMNNAEKDDDIDIFIITKKNRAWLTRGFVALLLSIHNKYAKGKNNKRKLCCSLFIDETKLAWNKGGRDLYIAHEIISIHPFINRNNMYFKFMKENTWALKYFPHYKISFGENNIRTDKCSFLVTLLEKLARQTQLLYMKPKRTSEIATKNMIHFNIHDHKNEILGKFAETKGK